MANLVKMSVNLVAAHLTSNQMNAAEVPAFLRSVFDTLKEMDAAEQSDRHSTAGTANASAPVDEPETRSQLVPAGPALDNSPDAAAALAAGMRPEIVAPIRQNILDDPAFHGLDPWLAARITPEIARQLDPVNPIHPSVYSDRLICLEDGKSVVLMRPYIRNRYGLSEEQYKCKWGLPASYPMSTPEFLERKRSTARKSQLGVAIRPRRQAGTDQLASAGVRPDEAGMASQADGKPMTIAAGDTPPAKRRGRPPKVKEASAAPRSGVVEQASDALPADEGKAGERRKLGLRFASN